MRFKVIKRVEAQDKGLHYFFTGKQCKWGHVAPRLTNKGATHAKYELGLLYSSAGMCYKCAEMMQENGGVIGKTFDEIMQQWNPHTSDDDTKLIPVVSGTKNIGYKVVGSSLVDSDLYFELSKILWIKDSRDYVKASMSKDNFSRITWNNICYHQECKYILLHRTILGIQGLSHKEVVGDHINGNTLDNRRCNLRLANPSNNSHNSVKSKNSTSQFIGVFYDNSRSPTSKKWRSRLERNGKNISRFSHTEDEAAKLYDSLLRDNHPSEFNVYNFPEVGERGRDGVIMVT